MRWSISYYANLLGQLYIIKAIDNQTQETSAVSQEQASSNQEIAATMEELLAQLETLNQLAKYL